MTQSTIRQYLHEAHATETGLVRVLQSQIAVTPRGRYRSALERHLRETRDHATRIERRLDELGDRPALVPAAIGAVLGAHDYERAHKNRATVLQAV